MTAGYSALFSAGLLAPSTGFGFDGFPKTPTRDRSTTTSSNNSLQIPFGDSSPIRPVSPLPRVSSNNGDDTDIDIDSSDVEVDRNQDVDMEFKRDSTPTQRSVSRARAGSGSSNGHGGAPRLRRRRSSLTITASPMNAIRSPIRTAGNAIQLQRALGRTRSGSVASSPPSESVFAFFGGGQNTASEGTSLMGRLRSGSVGASLGRPPPPPTGTIPGGRLRRHVRRTTTLPGPAPAPPPTAPLPDVPPVPALPPLTSLSMLGNKRAPLVMHNDTKSPMTTTTTPFGNAVKPTTRPTRDRGLSVSSNVETIDEEMKEN